jgi:hypothetical protein
MSHGVTPDAFEGLKPDRSAMQLELGETYHRLSHDASNAV